MNVGKLWIQDGSHIFLPSAILCLLLVHVQASAVRTKKEFFKRKAVLTPKRGNVQDVTDKVN